MRTRTCLTICVGLLFTTLIAGGVRPARAADVNPYQEGLKALGRKHWARAVEHFDEALGLNLAAYEAHLGRGAAFSGLRDYQRALADFDAAARLRPTEPKHLVARARTLERLRDFAGAINCYRRAINLRPVEPDYHNELAWALATYPVPSVRDGPGAMVEASEAVRLAGGRKPGYLDTLAAACAEAGQFEQAVQLETEVIARAGRDPGRGTDDRAGDYQSRLRLYRDRRPLNYER